MSIEDLKKAPSSCKSQNPVNPDSDNEHLHYPIKFLIFMRSAMSIYPQMPVYVYNPP